MHMSTLKKPIYSHFTKNISLPMACRQMFVVVHTRIWKKNCPKIRQMQMESVKLWIGKRTQNRRKIWTHAVRKYSFNATRAMLPGLLSHFPLAEATIPCAFPNAKNENQNLILWLKEEVLTFFFILFFSYFSNDLLCIY